MQDLTSKKIKFQDRLKKVKKELSALPDFRDVDIDKVFQDDMDDVNIPNNIGKCF